MRLCPCLPAAPPSLPPLRPCLPLRGRCPVRTLGGRGRETRGRAVEGASPYGGVPRRRVSTGGPFMNGPYGRGRTFPVGAIHESPANPGRRTDKRAAEGASPYGGVPRRRVSNRRAVHERPLRTRTDVSRRGDSRIAREPGARNGQTGCRGRQPLRRGSTTSRVNGRGQAPPLRRRPASRRLCHSEERSDEESHRIRPCAGGEILRCAQDDKNPTRPRV